MRRRLSPFASSLADYEPADFVRSKRETDRRFRQLGGVSLALKFQFVDRVGGVQSRDSEPTRLVCGKAQRDGARFSGALGRKIPNHNINPAPALRGQNFHVPGCASDGEPLAFEEAQQLECGVSRARAALVII